MIPAMSFATGANEVPALVHPVTGNRNLNMNTLYKNSWPSERHNDDSNDPWYHGDYRAIGYVYVYGVFDKIRDIGEFDQ